MCRQIGAERGKGNNMFYKVVSSKSSPMMILMMIMMIVADEGEFARPRSSKS